MPHTAQTTNHPPDSCPPAVANVPLLTLALQRQSCQPAARPPPPTYPHSPSPTLSSSPLQTIPTKWKRKASTKDVEETEVYGLFIEVPKKSSGKKAKQSYDQHGPWKFRTSLSWTGFCDTIAQNMSCTSTTLDIDSFAWRQKPTGPRTNIRNQFWYYQMVSHICILQLDPIPNVYLIMNLPRASGKCPVSSSVLHSLHTNAYL